jgi:hypothetical protein
MALTPQQRAIYGRIGAAVARARHRPADLTAAGRAVFLASFLNKARELHPGADDAELTRVARELRRAHFLRLAAASSRARAAKAADGRAA